MTKPLQKTTETLPIVRNIVEKSSEITHLSAETNYTWIHYSDDRSELISYCLKKFEQALQPNFIRIHRSHLVNPNRIIRRDGGKLVMENGTALPISRRNLQKYKRPVRLRMSSHERDQMLLN